MAMTADTVLTEVFRRVRDPNRIATTNTLALAILSYVQRCLNIYTRSVVNSVALAVGSAALHNVTTDLPTIGRVELMRNAGSTQDLLKTSVSRLWELDKNWLGSSGTTGQAWAPVGRDVIAIYPAGAYSVTVVGPALTADLAAITDVLVVQDDQLENLIEFCEAIFTLRLRLFPAFESVQKRLAERFHVDPRLVDLAPGLMATPTAEKAPGIAAADTPTFFVEKIIQERRQRG